MASSVGPVVCHQSPQGDPHHNNQALDQLMTLVYDELHHMAHRQLIRARPGQTLNTTGLVHEAYLKLADHEGISFNDRSHFYAVCARAMRQIIVDYARRRLTGKHGGGCQLLPLHEVQAGIASEAELILAVNEALSGLARLGERLTRIVELRFFAGLTEQETAQALAISERTVQRDWKRARAWLRERMQTTTQTTTESTANARLASLDRFQPPAVNA